MILALDTGSDLASVALGNSEGALAFESLSTKRSAEGLIQAIDNLRERFPAEFESLRGIAVSVGPGSYTGIRIGLSLAQGLAFARDIEVIGVSALVALLVESAPADGEHEIGLSLRDGEALFGKFRVTNGTQQKSDEDSGKNIIIEELAPISCRLSTVDTRAGTDARSILAAAARVAIIGTTEQFVRVKAGEPIAALYGKPVQAKTLLERGIAVDSSGGFQ